MDLDDYWWQTAEGSIIAIKAGMGTLQAKIMHPPKIKLMALNAHRRRFHLRLEQIATQESSSSGRSQMTASVMPSMDEDDLSADEQQCLIALREGKRLLKQQHGASAMVRFEKALMLAKSLGEKIYERRATRGLAAAARLQVST